MIRLYVGNLNYGTTEDSLRDAFSEFGQVDEISIPTDRMTGRPRGFAFVQMTNDAEGKAAIEGLNGKDLEGRTLTVNEARERTPRSGGGGGGGRDGGYHGGGGRDGGRDGGRERSGGRSW
ncbi:MAG: RNA recognition motif domain-containing protein [Phycisphaerales bacterium]